MLVGCSSCVLGGGGGEVGGGWGPAENVLGNARGNAGAAGWIAATCD
jgi:hypothetical protein